MISTGISMPETCPLTTISDSSTLKDAHSFQVKLETFLRKPFLCPWGHQISCLSKGLDKGTPTSFSTLLFYSLSQGSNYPCAKLLVAQRWFNARKDARKEDNQQQGGWTQSQWWRMHHWKTWKTVLGTDLFMNIYAIAKNWCQLMCKCDGARGGVQVAGEVHWGWLLLDMGESRTEVAPEPRGLPARGEPSRGKALM